MTKEQNVIRRNSHRYPRDKQVITVAYKRKSLRAVFNDVVQSKETVQACQMRCRSLAIKIRSLLIYLAECTYRTLTFIFRINLCADYIPQKDRLCFLSITISILYEVPITWLRRRYTDWANCCKHIPINYRTKMSTRGNIG